MLPHAMKLRLFPCGELGLASYTRLFNAFDHESETFAACRWFWLLSTAIDRMSVVSGGLAERRVPVASGRIHNVSTLVDFGL